MKKIFAQIESVPNNTIVIYQARQAILKWNGPVGEN